jgi:copper resistance protein C
LFVLPFKRRDMHQLDQETIKQQTKTATDNARRLQAMRHRLLISALALILGLGVWGTALAHAKLVSSDPKDGAKLDAPPAKITLVFSEEIGAEKSNFTVTNASGAKVGEGKLDLNDLDRKTLSGTMDQNAGAGIYTVEWAAYTADDDHTEEGTITFTVGTLQAQPTTTVRPTTPQPTTTQPTAAAQPTAATQPTVAPSNMPNTGNDAGQTVGWLLIAGAGAVLIGGLALRRAQAKGRS